MGSPSVADPFGTAELRRRVLAAWTDSPARFREDANAEEDLVRGGYRDRLLVELAQNAADAAQREGGPGRLRLELTGGSAPLLRAANTGVPLDAAGVQGLASLRASAKRDDVGSVGRFGVGFAAVLAVTDEPAVLSRTGGVRFSAARTRAAVAAVPDLAAELASRDGAVPVLRLPEPADGAPPQGFSTEVLLPLRPGTRDDVAGALSGLGAELLLALPGLAEIEVVLDGTSRVLARHGAPPLLRLADGDVVTRWAVATRTGELPAELLGGRAVEERSRRAWTITWAVPVDEGGAPRPLAAGQVVHAPTPSDEPVSLPLRLIAPFPLGPDRRHVLPGPVTDLLVQEAARAFAALVRDLPADPSVLPLLPRPRWAAGPLDEALERAVGDRLSVTDWLPLAGEEGRQAPIGAAVLDEATDERVAALTDVLPGLLPAAWSRRIDAPALSSLGVRRIGIAEAVEAVRGVDRPVDWWARLYAALDGADREELGALPVPLADGRTAHGPAGVLLPDEGLPVARLSPLGLRLAAPGVVALPAARRLLERLGARPATPAAVLADPAVRAAVEGSLEAVEDVAAGGPNPAELADAVLALVAAAGPAAEAAPWLAELALPDADGGWAPAGELLLPGSALADVLEPGSLGVLARDHVATADAEALRRTGVLDTFAVVSAEDPDELDVDAVDDWLDAVLDRLPAGAPPPEWPAVTAVRDLDLVADWPAALRLLVDLPAAAWDDVQLGGRALPGYLRWWLSTHAVLGGQRPDRLRRPGPGPLQGLYEPADVVPALLDRLRPPATVQDVLADVDGAADLLHRLGDRDRTVGWPVLRTVYAQVAQALDGVAVEPPRRVRVAPGRVVTDAVVLDAPWLQPLVPRPVVPAGGHPAAVADLLDLPLASEVVGGAVPASSGRPRRWAELPGAELAAARLDLDDLPGEVAVDERLAVGDRRVRWWPGEPDLVDGSPGSLGRALAWRTRRWELRQALTEAFAHPDGALDLAAEDAVTD
jgi:hypothetical protein